MIFVAMEIIKLLQSIYIVFTSNATYLYKVYGCKKKKKQKKTGNLLSLSLSQSKQILLTRKFAFLHIVGYGSFTEGLCRFSFSVNPHPARNKKRRRNPNPLFPAKLSISLLAHPWDSVSSSSCFFSTVCKSRVLPACLDSDRFKIQFVFSFRIVCEMKFSELCFQMCR